MDFVQQYLLTPESMTEFFTYIEGPKPDLTQVSPIQALKDYIEYCGGDPDEAIVHFAPGPPAILPENPGPQCREAKAKAKLWKQELEQQWHNQKLAEYMSFEAEMKDAVNTFLEPGPPAILPTSA